MTSGATIAGMMRIKNEARWIRVVLESALQVCDRIFVMDDHSTDGTADICRDVPGVTVYGSPFAGLDEARDKTWLLDQLRKESAAQWVLAIDGDELLTDHECITVAVLHGDRHGERCYALQVLYLWDRDDQVRTDGVYGRFWRPSLFRLTPGLQTFHATLNGGNFHCGNVPRGINGSGHCGARLLHFGYMHAADRRRKFDWYNLQDPKNMIEDQYRHMIQGDAGGPSAHARLRHAGPLKLEGIETLQ